MSLAHSYAQALLESATEKKVSKDEMDRMESQLDDFVRLIASSKELRLALHSPATTAKEKSDLAVALAEKAGAAKLLQDFLALVARKERFSHLEEIREAFAVARLESEGGLLGRVVSADPMERADLESLAQFYTKKLGRKVAFHAETDPELLAGLRVTVNGVTYDGTLRSQLQRLRERLIAGAQS